MTRTTGYNTGFASGGVMCKLEALCFYSSAVQVDSFVHRNPPERKAVNRWAKVSATLRLLPIERRITSADVSKRLRSATTFNTSVDLQNYSIWYFRANSVTSQIRRSLCAIKTKNEHGNNKESK